LLSLIRWIITPDSGALKRREVVEQDPVDRFHKSCLAQVELLRSRVIPLRRQIPHLSYAARQGTQLWLTVLASKQECDRLAATVAFDDYSPEIVREFTGDLLLPESESYRVRLHQATDLAFDLLTAGELAAHQRFLVLAKCRGVATEQVLPVYLDAHSRTHRRWTTHQSERFWAGFYEWGPAGLSYPGHWLWNLVVGPEPEPGEDPMPLLCAVGAWEWL
jgi:hypothetical protein